MPEETGPIIIDNDVDAEVSYVRVGGREWKFVYERGSVAWWTRFNSWSKNETTIVENEGPEANLKQLYDLAEEIFVPENGDRAALERRGPVGVASAMRLFASAWFSGPSILTDLANRIAAVSQAEPMAPDIEPPAEAEPKRRARRSA